jgi:hypothetical protein
MRPRARKKRRLRSGESQRLLYKVCFWGGRALLQEEPCGRWRLEVKILNTYRKPTALTQKIPNFRLGVQLIGAGYDGTEVGVGAGAFIASELEAKASGVLEDVKDATLILRGGMNTRAEEEGGGGVEENGPGPLRKRLGAGGMLRLPGCQSV